MLLAEFSMWPMDKGASIGKYVARLLEIIDRSGMAYKLGPLGTCVEGETADVLALIHRCQQELERDCDRVVCTVKMDWRRGESGRLESKVQSVERQLGRKLRT